MHNGSYSYDGAGRLVQCIDSATGLTEIYTWNADSTLASMPGPGYTREFAYNEEAQLLGISHSGTLAYQYAYGTDGNSRWSKDIANGVWTWYPCGVACGAGEMVEETSDLTGSSWTTSGQYLRVGGGCSSMLIRRKSSTDDEYHHVEMVGMFGVLTTATGSILQNNVSDAYAVPQYVDQNSQVQSMQLAKCLVTTPEPEMLKSSGGIAVLFNARALKTNSKKSTKGHPCKKKKHHVPCTTWLCGVEHCLVDAFGGGAAGCVATLAVLPEAKECANCITLAAGICVAGLLIPWIDPELCGAALDRCDAPCGKAFIACLITAGIMGSWTFLQCYNDTFHSGGF